LAVIDRRYSFQLIPGHSLVAPGDPARVRYILIAHGHADHFGGARYFQDKYGTKIAAAAEDWDAIAPPSADGNQNRPKRDIVLAEGQPFEFGDMTVTPVATPGHTPGSLAFIFPVKDNGVTRVAGLFGGAMLTMTLT
jgi:metallo-beta-lactamase class B